ncbi:hypothetical protein NDU88_005888 [Pleurodeles waltl]|uniref:Uncharacterized protein n=1 Tax=Pleurodeles waltl TaxID=8319 RepID=A0AAV7NP43_PLEWA|nr:hypothetical protein NDU88_005888 [Pleurodeles waltl]
MLCDWLKPFRDSRMMDGVSVCGHIARKNSVMPNASILGHADTQIARIASIKKFCYPIRVPVPMRSSRSGMTDDHGRSNTAQHIGRAEKREGLKEKTALHTGA